MDWCDQTLRAQFNQLEEVKIKNSWFKVYKVDTDVYAIAEPYNFQEVISYLILGDKKALLFDTGMGMSSIKSVVTELTTLPVVVLNSHTHYDHIGGNHEFENIMALKHPFTLGRAKNGMPHKRVQHEVTREAFCAKKLPALDTSTYNIKSFIISKYIKDSTAIALGNRTLKIIAVPGHTPDALALWDEENGLLWTGDTFYEAPIWLFDPETNLQTYQNSIRILAQLTPNLNKVFPAHNTPIAAPERLEDLVVAFNAILDGSKQAETSNDINAKISVFKFPHFSFMIRKELLSQSKP